MYLRIQRHLYPCLMLSLLACSEPDLDGPRKLDVTAKLELSERPVLVLGVAEGDSSQAFDAISGVAFVGDDRIAVSDRSRTIRFFSLDGAHLETVGGHGQGPEEFQFITQILRGPGGGVLAYDNGNRTIQRFDSSGRHIETIPVRGRKFTTATGLASVGEEELVAIGFYSPRVPPGTVYVRDTVAVLLLKEWGRRQDSIGAVPAEAYLYEGAGTFWGPPMPPRTRIAGWEDTFAVSVGDQRDIRLFDLSGRAFDAFSTVGSQVEVTPAMRRSYLAEYQEWRGLIGIPQSLPFPEIWERNFPEALPFYDDLLWGGTCLWIRHFRPPGSDTQVWDVARPGTDHVGRLEMPSSYRVHAIRGPLLAATIRDDLGVQRVEVAKVEKMGSECAGGLGTANGHWPT